MKVNYRIFLPLLLLTVNFVSGCGGGGGSDDNVNIADGSPIPSPNNAPTADAGISQNVTRGTTVSLNGANSADRDNDALSFNWTLTSIPNGSGASLSPANTSTPSFTADISGAYTVSLVVNDGTVNSSADTVIITATAPAPVNIAPVAIAGNAQNVTTGTRVDLNGSASSDANGDILTYLWQFTARPDGSMASLSSSTVQNPNFTADLVGTYTASLIVNDGLANSNADTVIVTVTDTQNPANVSVSLSAHNDNVLMVMANVVSSEISDVTIQFSSADTPMQQSAQSSASLEHDITIVGLRPQTSYQFTAVVTNQSGAITNSEPQTFTTPNLPFDLPDIQLITSSENSYGGITFFSVTGADARFIGVDEAGIPVWYLHGNDIPMITNSPAIKYIGNSQLMLLLRREVRVIDMLGNIISSYALPSYHHEATLLDNGNVAILVNAFQDINGNSVKGDIIEEYNTSGALVWSWSTFDYLDTERFPGALSTREVDGAMEWTHANGIYQHDDGSLLLSVRSQSWVINIDRTSGDINWIMGSAQDTVKASLQDKFLTLTQGSWMSAQHTPMEMTNGDILIFDNRNESELSGAVNNSRVVRYQINPTAMTATQVFESLVDKYTQSLGDVDELPNGNIFITAGGPGSNDNAYLVEVNAQTPSQVVWELHVNNESIYRAERISWDAFLGVSSNSTAGGSALSGKITGLHGAGLEVVNGGETLSLLAGATTFAFTQNVAQGASYNVQLLSEPANHVCTVNNGLGTMNLNTNDIVISCNDSKVNYDLTRLPIGDPLILQRALGDTGPAVGKLWLCRVPADGGGAAASDDWKNADGSWNFITKPKVDGANTFDSNFNVVLDGQGNRLITGNNLPDFPAGTFPVERGTLAWDYDKNPNVISSKVVNISFDAIPTVNAQPTCVGFGANGVSLAGAAIYQGSSTLGTDAAAWEILDNNGGHTDGTSTYHYHYLAEAVLAELDPDNGGHSALMGYIQDGFGIFGPRGEDGDVLASADLDECHGHTHEIEWDGVMREMFHYHWTYDFPYNVGCFRGTPQDLGINNG